MPEGTMKQNFGVSTGPLPASRKISIAGRRHPELRVQMREIDLSPAAKEPPVRVYDPSGPYTDPAVAIDIRLGLAPLRGPWIDARGDVEDSAARSAIALKKAAHATTSGQDGMSVRHKAPVAIRTLPAASVMPGVLPGSG